MLNRIILMGRLTHEPELRHTMNNVPVTSLSLAHERAYGGMNGEKITDFHNVVAWRGTAEFAAKYLSKGRLVVVSGKIQNRTYTDTDGRKIVKTEICADEICFADSNRNSGVNRSSEAQHTSSSEGDIAANNPGCKWEELAGEDVECPF